MAKRQYTVEVEITAKDKAGKPITKLVKGAMTDLAKSGRAASLSLLEMADSLSKASKTDAARTALTQLKRVLDSGEMSFEDYRDAVDKTQMSFGLATPASKKLAGEIDDLTNRLAKGEITADEYDRELRQLTKGLKNVDDAAEETSGVMKLMDGVMMQLGQQVVSFVQRLPGMVVDLVKLGATVERQTTALDNLAASAGTSGAAIVAAIQEASNFTIDRMTAMQVANRAMMLDVAKTPEQFERLTRVAVRLGQAMGLDAATAINDFVTAAGRQSVMIADNLGLTVKIGDATEMYAEKLGKAVDELTDAERKQAFLNAMLESGEVKVAELGEATGDTAGDIETLTAGLSDLETVLAKAAAASTGGAIGLAGMGLRASALSLDINRLQKEMLALNLITEEEVSEFRMAEGAMRRQKQGKKELAERVRMLAALQKEYNGILEEQGAKTAFLAREQAEMNATWQASIAARQASIAVYEKSREAMERVSYEGAGLQARLERIDEAVAEYNETWRAAEQVGVQAERAMVDLADGLNDTGSAADWAERKAMNLAQSLAEIEAASIVTASAALSMGMNWKTFFDRNEEQATNWAERREKIEQDSVDNITRIDEDSTDKIAKIETGHANRMAGIRAKGRSTAIELDADAEQTKLDDLKWRLGQALLQQSEFGEKVKASTRSAKEHQIETLRGQITEQETLLSDYYGGRLVKQGANISSELAAEQARYAEELRLAGETHGEQTRLSGEAYEEQMRQSDEAQTAMLEAQKKQMGQMILQSFESWATMKGIPADRMLEMRTDIAEEYGLMDSETANAVKFMTGQWEKWATDMGLSTDDVIGNLGLYMEKTGLVTAEAGGYLDTHEKDMADWREALIDDMGQVSTAMGEHKADPRAMADEVEDDTRGMADDWVAWKDSVIEGTATVKGEMAGLIIKSGDYSTATATDTGAMTEDWQTYREALGDDIIAMEEGMDGAAVETGEMAATSGEYLDDNSGDWQEWEDSIGRSTAETVSHMDEVTEGVYGVKDALAELPREVRIQLIIEQQGGIPGLQRGTGSFRGGLAMVGEAGPELVALPSGTQVWPSGSGPSRTTHNNFNMTVNTQAPFSTVIQDYETMVALMP